MDNNPYSSTETVPTADQGKYDLTLKQKLFSFKGRVRRKDYWIMSIVSSLILIIPGAILLAIAGEDIENPLFTIGNILFFIGYIPMVWISLALSVKRWHDREKSGWFVLIGLIPLVGAIWTFVEAGCLPGSEGSNKFGADPKSA